MEIPEKVSWRIVDAWLVMPPCTSGMPYCHVQCPYYYECHPDAMEDEIDKQLDEYYE